jgi:hypothetical protein
VAPSTDPAAATTSPRPGAVDPAPARPRAHGRFAGLGVFGLLLLLTAAWSLASPLMSAPDEPAHATKAAAVVRGEWLGRDVGGATAVEVPEAYWDAQSAPLCYYFKPEVPAGCAPELEESPRDVYAETTAGRYNPVYYLLTGWTSLVDEGAGGMWAMRLATAALSAALLAAGVQTLREVPRPGWLLAGAFTAITPMVVYLAGTISPAGPEIAAAFAVWAAALALLRHDEPVLRRRRLVRLALAAVVLVSMRGFSPLFLAVALLAPLMSVPFARTRELLRERAAWVVVGVGVVATGAATAWIIGTNSLGSGGEVAHPDLTFLGVVKHSLLQTWIYTQNMLGQFGWVDTWLPAWLYRVLAVAVLALLALALLVGRTRDRLVLLAVTGFTFLAPAVLHASQARYLGIIWQGRYFLPAAVGMVLLAAWVLRDAPRHARLEALHAPRTGVVAAAVAGALAVVAQTTGVLVVLQRFMNGVHGPSLLDGPAAWTPPLPWWSLVLVAAVCTGVAAVVAVRDARGRRAVAP